MFMFHVPAVNYRQSLVSLANEFIQECADTDTAFERLLKSLTIYTHKFLSLAHASYGSYDGAQVEVKMEQEVVMNSLVAFFIAATQFSRSNDGSDSDGVFNDYFRFIASELHPFTSSLQPESGHDRENDDDALVAVLYKFSLMCFYYTTRSHSESAASSKNSGTWAHKWEGQVCCDMKAAAGGGGIDGMSVEELYVYLKDGCDIHLTHSSPRTLLIPPPAPSSYLDMYETDSVGGELEEYEIIRAWFDGSSNVEGHAKRKPKELLFMEKLKMGGGAQFGREDLKNFKELLEASSGFELLELVDSIDRLQSVIDVSIECALKIIQKFASDDLHHSFIDEMIRRPAPSLSLMNLIMELINVNLVNENDIRHFIANLISSCNFNNSNNNIELVEVELSRRVQLCCLFIESLLKRDPFLLQPMLLELETFTMSHSKQKEALSLFQKLKSIYHS